MKSPNTVLAFAALVEIGTGLVLLVDPAIVLGLLLGAEASDISELLGRCFGIALLALGLACWPRRQTAETHWPALVGMLIYNLLIATYIAFLALVGEASGVLLWPAAGLHALVAAWLVWAWQNAPSAEPVEQGASR